MHISTISVSINIYTHVHAFPAFIFGLMNIALAFMVFEMQNSSLFQIANLVAGVLVGPIGGIFLLGILIPWANTMVRILPSIMKDLVSCCQKVPLSVY